MEFEKYRAVSLLALISSNLSYLIWPKLMVTLTFKF